MQTVRKKVHFTYQDYLHIQGDKHHEIIDGDIHMTPSPASKHQKIVTALTVLLANWVNEKKIGEVIVSPMDVVLSEEDVVQPDILFIGKERLEILTETHVRGAPDLVVEVLSKSSIEWDRQVKRKLYDACGVREYWIVDPDAHSVEVLSRQSNSLLMTRTFTGDDHLCSSLLPGFSMNVSKLFGILR